MKEFGRSRDSHLGSFIVDSRGTILGFDQGMEALTGWPAVRIVGRNKDLDRTLTDDRDRSRAPASVPLYDGKITMIEASKTLPLTMHCRDGSVLEIDAVANRLPGPGKRMLVTTLRVLSSSPAEPGPEQLDGRDPLTGLLNGDAFGPRLEAEFRAALGAARPLALILIDIDRFRDINDRLGRETGDGVLERLAGVFRVVVKDENSLFRLGDDDFAVLMPDSGRGDARQLAAGIRSTVERYRFGSPELGTVETRLTLSLGAASFPADADDPSDLIGRARDALNEARAMGRNRVWCYLRRPRVPVHVPVFFDGAEALLVGYTRDISPSGIFVQTSAPVDVGMRCALTFPLPGHHGKVHVIGRVVRTVPPDHSDDDLRIPGMGVEFERFGGSNDRRTIDCFLHANEAQTLRPETGPLSF